MAYNRNNYLVILNEVFLKSPLIKNNEVVITIMLRHI